MAEPITDGKDRNFFEKITVVSTIFNNSADINIKIKNIKSFSLVNEGSAIIEYSFNGEVLHGDLTPGTPTAAIFFDDRIINKVWFRTKSIPSVVRIEAWGI